MLLLSSDDYASATPSELLRELSMGRAGFDHAFLNAFLKDESAALDALDAFVDGDHGDDLVDIEEQILHLYRHLRSPRAIPFYTLLLRAQMDGVQDELIEAFAELGAPAVQPLLDLYNEVEEEEGGEIAFVLAALQLKDDRITELLVNRLEYDAQDAAICLGVHGDPAARPAVETLLAGIEDTPENEFILRDLREAIERLSGEAEDSAREPYNIYDHYDEFLPPLFEAMEPEEALEWMQSPDPRVRLAVADSLDDAELTDDLVTSVIASALSDEDLQVRCALWKSLLPAEGSETLLQALRSRFEDGSTDGLERATLAIVLAKQDYTGAVKSAILDFYGNEELRPLAIEAMWYSNDTEFLQIIETHLEDDDVDIRRAAILGVGFFVDTSQASRLIPAMKIQDLRHDAIYAYALAHPGEVSRVTAQKVLKHVDQVAEGLAPDETELAMSAIDLRLTIGGGRPFFAGEE